MLPRAMRSPALRLVGRRLLQAIPVLWGVTFLTFALGNLLPGDSAAALLGPGATAGEVQALSIRLHLNEPFFTRYWNWFTGILSGHLGVSSISGVPVSSILAQRIPVTAELAVLALIFSVLFAIPVAVLAARRPRGVADRLSIVISMIGLSVPGFVLGLILILTFAVHAGILPAIGFSPISKGLWQNLKYMILPASTIGFALFCGYTRLLRADIVDQMAGEDYIVVVRAKGVRPSRVLIRHALPNSLFGLLTLVGLNLGTLIGGTVLIEEIFALPGIGNELIQAIDTKDLVVVEAIVMVMALSVTVANLVTDLLYTVLDPRIRHGRPAT